MVTAASSGCFCIWGDGTLFSCCVNPEVNNRKAEGGCSVLMPHEKKALNYQKLEGVEGVSIPRQCARHRMGCTYSILKCFLRAVLSGTLKKKKKKSQPGALHRHRQLLFAYFAADNNSVMISSGVFCRERRKNQTQTHKARQKLT